MNHFKDAYQPAVLENAKAFARALAQRGAAGGRRPGHRPHRDPPGHRGGRLRPGTRSGRTAGGEQHHLQLPGGPGRGGLHRRRSASAGRGGDDPLRHGAGRLPCCWPASWPAVILEDRPVKDEVARPAPAGSATSATASARAVPGGDAGTACLAVRPRRRPRMATPHGMQESWERSGGRSNLARIAGRFVMGSWNRRGPGDGTELGARGCTPRHPDHRSDGRGVRRGYGRHHHDRGGPGNHGRGRWHAGGHEGLCLRSCLYHGEGRRQRSPGRMTTARPTPWKPTTVSSRAATLGNGATFSFTFDKAGTYPYHCSIHPNMKGTVVVQ